jgi:integrase
VNATEATALEALRILGEVLRLHFLNYDPRKPEIPCSAEILREMIAELEDLGRSWRHLKSLRDCLKLFVEKFPRLEAVSDADLTAYLRQLSMRVGPRRRDNVLSAIVQLSRFARRRNYLPEDARSVAEKVRRIKPSHDVQTWTPQEARLLLEHVKPRWLPMMVLSLFAGLRTTEIFRLDWGAVKFDERVIAVSGKVARKTRIARLVPIQDNLLAWLEPYRDRVGPLFTTANCKTLENSRYLEMARIRRATGLPRKDNANRHSFGSYRLAVTKSHAQVALEMGNSPRMVRDNYNDPKSEADAAAYFGLLPPSRENVVPMPLPLEFAAIPRK